MEATQNRPLLKGARQFVGTRKGATTVAAAAAVLAGIVLLTFVNRYRDSVKGGTASVPALVAGRLIPKGTSGDIVVSGELFRPTTVAEDQLKGGAIADASVLKGKVATHDVYPGQQLTAADFASDADPLRGQLTNDERAVAVAVDGSHGLIGEVRAGDHVDVLAGFNASTATSGIGRPVLKTLLQNILVLKAPSSTGSGAVDSNKSGNVVLRTTDQQAGDLAFASDNGKIWIVLRPQRGPSRRAPRRLAYSRFS